MVCWWLGPATHATFRASRLTLSSIRLVSAVKISSLGEKIAQLRDRRDIVDTRVDVAAGRGRKEGATLNVRASEPAEIWGSLGILAPPGRHAKFED